MPPKKKLKTNQPPESDSEDRANADAMDLDNDPDKDESASDAASVGSMSITQPGLEDLTSYWTADQEASLFKATIRWKPAGMHRRFRMLAIHEHLRNHGFDPEIYPHIRIPHIWQKLRVFYNLDAIDERENFEEDPPEERYHEFQLPPAMFYDRIMQRVLDPDRDTSPERLNGSPSPSPPPDSASDEDLDSPPPPPKRKGRREAAIAAASHHAKHTRSSTIGDSEDLSDAAPRATPKASMRGRAAAQLKSAHAQTHARSTRGGRGRASAQRRTEETDESEEESKDGDDESDEEDEEDEQSSEEEAKVKPKGMRGQRTRAASAKSRPKKRR